MSAQSRRKRRLVFFTALLCLIGGLAVMQFRGYTKPSGLLGKLDVGYVVLDLSNGLYKASPELARDDAEEFSTMMARLKPFAAICGTYYDESGKPMGDIVSAGKVVSRGNQRQGVGFTADGRIRFLERLGRSRIDWKSCVSGIAGGPRLVRGGRKDINLQRDGFTPAASTILAGRCAIGATTDGKLILCAVAEPITLGMMADVMLELHARDAVNMDGGGMCALYKDGKYLVTPARRMSNILAVYKSGRRDSSVLRERVRRQP